MKLITIPIAMFAVNTQEFSEGAQSVDLVNGPLNNAADGVTETYPETKVGTKSCSGEKCSDGEMCATFAKVVEEGQWAQA